MQTVENVQIFIKVRKKRCNYRDKRHNTRIGEKKFWKYFIYHHSLKVPKVTRFDQAGVI